MTAEDDPSPLTAAPAATLAATLAEALADVHATAFDGTNGAAWDAAAFARLLVLPGVDVKTCEGGFVMVRTVADEAEILTLAVRPEARRRGLGLSLTLQAARAAREAGAARLFLEVAEGNAAARALYARAGFVEAGVRRGYYRRPDGSVEDARVLSLELGSFN